MWKMEMEMFKYILYIPIIYLRSAFRIYKYRKRYIRKAHRNNIMYYSLQGYYYMGHWALGVKLLPIDDKTLNLLDDR